MLQSYQRNASQPARSNLNLANKNRHNNQLANPYNMASQFDQISNQMMSMMDHQLGSLGFSHPFRGFDDIEDQMMEFSNMHRHMTNLNQRDVDTHARDGAFQVYSQCFVQSSKMGPDGKMVQEKYFDNNAVARGVNGHTVSERQQGYKNNQGIDKFAHERMMNDKGRKHLRERDHQGQVTTTNHYMNMDENQVEQFENEWLGMGKNFRLQAPPQRDMNSLPFPRDQIEYDQPIRRNVKNDISPIMLGGVNRSIPHNALPISNNFNNNNNNNINRPGVQIRQPIIQENRRIGNTNQNLRNQDLTGVYQNKGAKNQHPKAG